MKNQKQYDIFISYSRKDFDEVNAFVEMLKLRIPTLEIWFDLDGIESGDEFRDKIISAIKRSKYVLFALSKNSDQSEWTRKELGFAKGKGIKIVPVLLRGAHLQEMDWFLFEFSGVDCIDIVCDDIAVSENILTCTLLATNVTYNTFCIAKEKMAFYKAVGQRKNNICTCLDSEIEKIEDENFSAYAKYLKTKEEK